MSKREPNRYKRIMGRNDGMRPDTLKDKLKKYPDLSDCFVMRIKLLTPDGSVVEFSWSEKEADRIAKERG